MPNQSLFFSISIPVLFGIWVWGFLVVYLFANRAATERKVLVIRTAISSVLAVSYLLAAILYGWTVCWWFVMLWGFSYGYHLFKLRE